MPRLLHHISARYLLFAAGGMVFAVDETVFAMDGAVSLQNRQPAAC